MTTSPLAATTPTALYREYMAMPPEAFEATFLRLAKRSPASTAETRWVEMVADPSVLPPPGRLTPDPRSPDASAAP